MTGTQPTIGDYRLAGRIGGGAMGSVYRAVHAPTGAEVAIKLLPPGLTADPTARGYFRRGAASAATLHHPNILPVWGYGEQEDTPYLVTPYIAGGTLKDRMLAGPLSPAEAVGYLRQLAAALDFAHAQGVVHRDVKPANLLLDARGQLYLADFGIARALEGATGYTRTGMAVGTPEYMAPEQARGQAEARSDRYAAGIVCYQLLTGQLPFGGDSAVAIMLRQVQEPLPLAPLRAVRPALPPAVERVLQRALAKEPEGRYASVAAFVDDLEAALAGAPVAADRPTLPTPPSAAPRLPAAPAARRSGRAPGRLVAALGAALVALFLLGGGYVAWGQFGGRAGAAGAATAPIAAQATATATARVPTATAAQVAATATAAPAATRTPAPARTPTAATTQPNGARAEGWRTYAGTAQAPFAVYYPGDWTLDLSREREGSVTFWAPNKTAFVRIGAIGRAAEGSNLDQLRDELYNGEIALCARNNCEIGGVQKTGYDPLNPRFAWFLTTVTYTNGTVADLRDGIALKGETMWVYNVLAQRNDRNNTAEVMAAMLASLNIYANP